MWKVQMHTERNKVKLPKYKRRKKAKLQRTKENQNCEDKKQGTITIKRQKLLNKYS